MKRFGAVAALLAAVAATLFVARADAILFGRPDGNDHRGVGYGVFYDSAHAPLWPCTGSLVARPALLRAGHCAGTFESQAADGSFVERTPTRAQVWFDKQID